MTIGHNKKGFCRNCGHAKKQHYDDGVCGAITCYKVHLDENRTFYASYGNYDDATGDVEGVDFTYVHNDCECDKYVEGQR